MSNTITKEEIKKVISDLEYQLDRYGDRIVSLDYTYEYAINQLLIMIGEEEKYQ